jgi:hypothetical protein
VVGAAVIDRAAPCRICEGPTAPFGETLVLDDVPARFRRCQGCGAVLADEPDWLDAAYSRPIGRRDIGLVQRNLQVARQVDAVVRAFGDRGRPVLDFGAGNGMLVRLLRDRGLDARYLDSYAENLFAEGFEWDPAGSPPGAVLAVEVVEHLLDPVASLAPLIEGADLLVVSTEIVPDPAPPLGSWWYYSLDNGQHITIFGPGSIAALAGRLGLSACSFGSIHVLSRRRLAAPAVRLALSGPGAAAIRRLRPTPSRLDADFEARFGDRLELP